jgi:glycosyltransferase involved in cell wall biosynthesis
MRKKILYVTSQNPWDNNYGGGIRNNHIIEGLCNYHDLHIILASTNRDECESFLELAPLEQENLHLLNELSSNSYNNRTLQLSNYLATLMGIRNFNKPFIRTLHILKPDLVWYFQKYSARSVGLPGKTPYIIDLDNVNWNLFRRTAKYKSGVVKYSTLIKMCLSLIEERLLVRNAYFTVISNPDERNKFPSNITVNIIDNGFNYPKKLELNQDRKQRILFLGSLFHYPNLDGLMWFCNEIWPKIITKMPGTKLDIVGHIVDPDDINNIEKFQSIEYHGFVKDIDPFIKTNACLIVPLRFGSGTRIKILESWAKGLPVVSTTLGAEGLGATNHHSILIGDTPEEFSDACLRILANPKLRNQLAMNAYLFSKEKYNWNSIYSRIKLLTQA